MEERVCNELSEDGERSSLHITEVGVVRRRV